MKVAQVGQAGQQCTQSCVQSILCAHHHKGYLYHMVEKSLLGDLTKNALIHRHLRLRVPVDWK